MIFHKQSSKLCALSDVTTPVCGHAKYKRDRKSSRQISVTCCAQSRGSKPEPVPEWLRDLEQELGEMRIAAHAGCACAAMYTQQVMESFVVERMVDVAAETAS